MSVLGLFSERAEEWELEVVVVVVVEAAEK
jgi:hypothetical protein